MVSAWPMADSLTDRSPAISGSTPAGSASVKIPMNAAVPSASSGDQGSFRLSAAGESARSSVWEVDIGVSSNPHIDVNVKTV